MNWNLKHFYFTRSLLINLQDSVLEFLTSLDSMDNPDRIEEVNAKILDKLVHEEGSYVAVLFCKLSLLLG